MPPSPTLALRQFGTLTIQTDPDGLFMLGTTSVGQRIIQEFASVRFDGERLHATMTARAGADWLTVDPTGRFLVVAVICCGNPGAGVTV